MKINSQKLSSNSDPELKKKCLRLLAVLELKRKRKKSRYVMFLVA